MLVYSSPAKSKDYNEDGTKLENITRHINYYQWPWIWVFDGGGMGFRDYTEFSFTMGLLDALAKNKNLKEIWVIRSNLWLSGTISLLKTISSEPILEKIRMIEGSLFETGMDTDSLLWLNEQCKE